MSSHCSPVKKYFHKDILFSLTKILTPVSEGYKIVFFQSGIFSNVLAWPQVTLILILILIAVIFSEWISAKVRHAII